MDISEEILNHKSASFSPADLAAYYTAGHAEPWRHAAHLALINEAILLAYNGGVQRVAAFLPPRYGKSHLISKYTPAWWLGHRPDAKVVMTSFSHTRATDWSKDARDVLATVGPKLFGVKTRLGTGKGKDDNWGVEKLDASGEWIRREGGMVAGGIKTGISGLGANLLIVDDPITGWPEAYSETFQRTNWDWWKGTATNRLEPNGVVLYIQTRWCQLDLAGKILDLAKEQPDQFPWIVIRFPEWAEVDEVTPVSIVGGENNVTQELIDWAAEKNAEKRFHRMKGDILWPERWNLRAVKERKAKSCEGGELMWQAIHQQDPQPGSGMVFNPEFFQIVSSVPVDAVRVRYWDLAATQGGGDWTAGVAMSYSPEEQAFYIEDVIRGQWSPGEVEKNVELAAQMDGYQVAIRIEEEGGASGKSLVGVYARMLSDYDFAGRRAKGPKINRWRRMVGAMERGNMYIVQGEWNQDFIRELSLLPGGKHDDQADAAAGAYAELIEMDRLSPSAELV